MTIDFKSATISDEEVLMNLRGEFIASVKFPDQLEAETNHRLLLSLIDNKQFGRMWLIKYDGKIAGYLVLTFGFSLEYSGRNAFIDELFLREQFRGLGIGRQAVNFVTEFCRAEDIKTIHLEVEQDNETAKGLYRKTGFVNYERYFLTKWIKVKA